MRIHTEKALSRLAVATLVGLSLAVGPGLPAVQAADLMTIWRAAQVNDPGYRAAKTDQKTGLARLEQAKALSRPQVSLTGAAGLTSLYSSTQGAQFYSSQMGSGPYEKAEFNTSIYLGATARAALVAVAPLFDQTIQANAQQLNLSAKVTDLMSDVSRQFLAISVVERYLDVLAAQEMVRLMSQQLGALERAHVQLEKRLKLGDVSRVDVDESLERIAQLRAERLSRESQLVIANRALADLAGQPQQLKTPVFQPTTLDPMVKKELTTIVSNLKSGHPMLRAVDLRRQMSLLEAKKYASGQEGVRVQAVGSVGIDGATGYGDYGHAKQGAANQFVGLQVVVPLSTGGFRSAKAQELAIEADRLLDERAQRALELEQGARAAHLSAQASQVRIDVLGQRLETAKRRLVTTERAYQQGARSTLEWLAAQSAVFDAEGQLYLERLAVARQLARRQAQSGQLSDEQLAQLTQYLQ
jgi:outer membrane protein